MSEREKIAEIVAELDIPPPAFTWPSLDRLRELCQGYTQALDRAEKAEAEREELRAVARGLFENRFPYEAAAEAMQGGTLSECEHEWTDARNQIIQSGWICLKCNAVRGDEP